MRAPTSDSSGFTLPELMIALAIVSILLAIAMPRFADLLRRSREGATRGNLGAIRGALTIYYGDTEGAYPADLAALEAGDKYLDALPATKLSPLHPESSAVSEGATLAAAVSDGGGWGYVDGAGDADWGRVFVDCTHSDLKGQPWTGF